MLKFENVSLRYGSFLALDGVSLHADRGELVVLLGANGAGKSSLFLTASGMVFSVSVKVTTRGEASRTGSPGPGPHWQASVGSGASSPAVQILVGWPASEPVEKNTRELVPIQASCPVGRGVCGRSTGSHSTPVASTCRTPRWTWLTSGLFA